MLNSTPSANQLNHFWWRHNRSNPEISTSARFWVDLTEKTIIVRIRQTNFRKRNQYYISSRRKSINHTVFKTIKHTCVQLSRLRWINLCQYYTFKKTKLLLLIHKISRINPNWSIYLAVTFPRSQMTWFTKYETICTSKLCTAVVPWFIDMTHWQMDRLQLIISHQFYFLFEFSFGELEHSSSSFLAMLKTSLDLL